MNKKRVLLTRFLLAHLSSVGLKAMEYLNCLQVNVHEWSQRKIYKYKILYYLR
jgi:hypothetical protein